MKKLFILVLALVMAFAALPAFAQDKADWAFYGSVRMWTAWDMVDDNTPPQLSNSGFFPIASTAAKARPDPASATGNLDDSELEWLLQGNSRIGAKVKWGDIGGTFEYGSTPNLRLLYGTWNFGAGTLLLGQDYGPYFYLVSGLCGPGGGECNGIGFGSIYTGRIPQIKLIFGGLQVALERPEIQNSFTFAYPAGLPPDRQSIANIATNNSAVRTDYDQTLPRLAASYTFNMGPGQFFIGGTYNSYTEHYTRNAADVENDIDAWVLGAGAKLGFGPFYVNATVQYGSNPNNALGPWITLYPSVQLYDNGTGNSEDSSYMAAQLILGFKLTDSLVFEGGVIWQNGEVDDVSVTAAKWSQDTWVYYIGFGYSPAKNVFIVPELGIIDYNKLKVENVGADDINFGKLTWIGIKWQINF